MTWSAHIQHTPQGLALTFGAPTTRLDMTGETAAHLASLLAIEARRSMLGVVETLTAAGVDTVYNCKQKLPPVTVERHAHFCDCLDCMSPGDRQ